jgi:hypothetical protein
MKCPNCQALCCPSDNYCVSCRGSFSASHQTDAKAATPPWAYVFAALCVAIPLVTLGGCVPSVIGFGGSGACLTVARSKSTAAPLRFVVCMGITVICWLGFVMVLVALNPALKAHISKIAHH